MSERMFTLDGVRNALVGAGFEVFRAGDDTIQLAQRVRSHLMDAGVSVQVTEHAVLSFVVRTQRVDFPSATPAELFERIRAAVGGEATQHGFAESHAASRELLDPGDATRVLDLWHELTFSKPMSDEAALLADLRWALALPKYVGP
jgi:hypothetical protein